MPELPEHPWSRTEITLHSAFALLTVLAAVTTLLSPQTVPAGRPTALAALAALTLAYLVAGRPALCRESGARAVAYLIVLAAVVGALSWGCPDALFLLFIAYPQVWFLAGGTRTGVLWTLLVFATGTGGMAAHLAVSGEGLWSAVASQLVGLAFSVLLGAWTYQVLDQSRRQSALIAELERTQRELASAHHERGVLAERERLAREVHDTLAQGYTSVVMLAQTALAALGAEPDVARDRLELIAEVARDNLRDARALVAALSPVELDGSTLADALRSLADRFGRETGVVVRVDLDVRAAGLRRDEEVVLLRAAQEALSNARRHAGADSVTLSLANDGNGVAIRVDDDGVGFDTSGAVGRGLTGLRRRLEQAGGTLEIRSALGTGTRVVARLVPGA